MWKAANAAAYGQISSHIHNERWPPPPDLKISCNGAQSLTDRVDSVVIWKTNISPRLRNYIYTRYKHMLCRSRPTIGPRYKYTYVLQLR